MAVQTWIDAMIRDKSIEGVYGETPEWKEECTTQVIFMNIGGLPFNIAASKNREMRTLVCLNKVDILGLAETDVNWTAIPFIYLLQECMMTWWESWHITMAHNVHDLDGSRRQWGGVAQFSINKIAHQVFESG